MGTTIKKAGSQGQQKTYLVSLKLAQFDFIKQISGIKPILLLDDLFDKFDSQRVREIIELVAENHFGQIFISDTHADRNWDYNFSDGSITMQDAIYNALQGYNPDYVRVYQAFISGDYMNRYTGSSIARKSDTVSLSPEAQAAQDALKAARAAARPAKPTK